jgi:hypothetical protein
MRSGSRWALSVAAVLAYLTFSGTAAAFGPEPARTVDGTSTVAAAVPAPEAPPIAREAPAPTAPVQRELGETVVPDQYQSPDIEAAPTPIDTAGAAPAPAPGPAETGRQLDEPQEPVSPGAARDLDALDAQPSELKLLRKVRQDESAPKSAGQTGEKWYRAKHFQYQSASSRVQDSDISHETFSPSLSPFSPSVSLRKGQAILAQIRVDTRPETTQYRTTQYRLKGTALTREGLGTCAVVLSLNESPCENPIQHAGSAFAAAARSADSRQASLIEIVLGVKDSEMIEAVRTRFRLENARLIECAAGHTLRSGSGPSSPRPKLGAGSEARGSAAPPGAGGGGETSFRSDTSVAAQGPSRAVKALARSKSVGTALVKPLKRVLPTASLPRRPEAPEQLTDTRRLVQIGLMLGMAYVAFLTFWFWGTRVRGRKARGGARF